MFLGFLTACSGGEPPAKEAIIAKIKSDPQTRGASDRTAGCLAEWYLKYATPEQVSAFVEGEAGDRPLDQVAADPQARSVMLDCLKAAADDR
ncbi:hypothetical protein GCM10017567_44640 [Amycolatopsis bullii]|uniref:Lipoprotein n=1 Tax=Amycolatopsis bullii TaxID=941987 RepID=A0ABQ3KFU5_9PSEU|nr:hypothetical protein GCM10017567_44640 [Amycolatopsis bullii]